MSRADSRWDRRKFERQSNRYAMERVEEEPPVVASKCNVDSAQLATPLRQESSPIAMWERLEAMLHDAVVEAPASGDWVSPVSWCRRVWLLDA